MMAETAANIMAKGSQVVKKNWSLTGCAGTAHTTHANKKELVIGIKIGTSGLKTWMESNMKDLRETPDSTFSANQLLLFNKRCSSRDKLMIVLECLQNRVFEKSVNGWNRVMDLQKKRQKTSQK